MESADNQRRRAAGQGGGTRPKPPGPWRSRPCALQGHEERRAARRLGFVVSFTLLSLHVGQPGQRRGRRV